MDPLRARYPRYFAYEDLVSAAERVVSGYRRTVDGGTSVEFTHSYRDASLPSETVRVTVGREHPDARRVYDQVNRVFTELCHHLQRS